MKNYIFLFIFLLSSCKILGQEITDVSSVFKMCLFLDRINTPSSDRTKVSSVKNLDLFYKFRNTINFKIDTLRSKGFEDTNFKFYAINLEEIEITKELDEEDYQSILLFSGKTNLLLLGLNTKSGQSYRLKGFNGNDFQQFISDFALNDFTMKSKKNKKRYFLKTYEVEHLDFQCLFKATNSKNIMKKKYDCLCKYSEPLVIF